MRYNCLLKCSLGGLVTALVAMFIVAPLALAAAENSQYVLGNGIRATMYSPDQVMNMVSKDSRGRLILTLPGGASYALIESVQDPQITNKGDGTFHPIDSDLVLKALSSIDLDGRRIELSVNIYILPLPRDGYLASSSCGNDIILSPGVYEVCGRTCAYVVSHEIGHVFQHNYLPSDDVDPWVAYLKLRGIWEDPRYTETAAHAYRPTEIFAEDFRYLFGGEEAHYTGTIENPSLPLPDEVSGLREFIADLAPAQAIAVADAAAPPGILVSNYPNPFNPVTTIHALFRGGFTTAAETDVALYRVDGTLVRRVFHGMVSGDELTARWDGRDESGSAVSSGVYICVVRRGDARSTSKMLLIR
jgi:hypothetical protein